MSNGMKTPNESEIMELVKQVAGNDTNIETAIRRAYVIGVQSMFTPNARPSPPVATVSEEEIKKMAIEIVKDDKRFFVTHPGSE